MFFGAALKDMVCLPIFGKETLKKYAKGPTTIHEFDGDHWILLSHMEEVNRKLLAWLDGLKL